MKSITLFPATCECTLDGIKKIQIIKCRTHNSYQECLDHNKTFANPRTNESEKDFTDRRDAEQRKTQFQRR